VSNTGEIRALLSDDGCTKGAFIDGMVLQQSWPSRCPCDEQGIESQHCVARSGVVVAPQSTAYTASATTIPAIRIGLAKRIISNLDPPSIRVKHVLTHGHIQIMGRRSSANPFPAHAKKPDSSIYVTYVTLGHPEK
jgi:hypothetical protein